MSATIITFPSSTDSKNPQDLICDTTSKIISSQSNSAASLPKKPSRCKDGRRKDGAKSRSIEPNIQEILTEDGQPRYRVQIRKTSGGHSYSLAKTFSRLQIAKKWKVKKLAELELTGLDLVVENENIVADAINARLDIHKHLGRSAKQQLTWLKDSYFGQKKLIDLSLSAITELADEMLCEGRKPQTVAGYLTILIKTLDWASRRDFTVPVASLRLAMDGNPPISNGTLS